MYPISSRLSTVNLAKLQYMAANVPSILIKNADPEAFNLSTVTQSPRSSTAIDVRSACANLVFDLEAGPGDTAAASYLPLVEDFVKYLFTEYFARVHQTGLYNRQMRLWESFSKVLKVDFKQQEGGFLFKSPKPAVSLSFRSSGLVVALALILLDDAAVRGDNALYLVQDMLNRAAKLQGQQGNGSLGGVFITSAQKEDKVYNYLVKATGGEDPVARYDCYMPGPYYVHVNMLTYSQEEGEGRPDYKFDLIYPNLERSPRK